MKIFYMILRLLEMVGDHIKSEHRKMERQEHQREVDKANERPVEWFEHHFNGTAQEPEEKKPDKTTGGH